MMRSHWVWHLLDTEERVLRTPPSPAFTTRFDAEAWLGEHWRELAGQGVAAVRLTDGGSAVGGDLPLRDA
jgi:hypothetical protein